MPRPRSQRQRSMRQLSDGGRGPVAVVLVTLGYLMLLAPATAAVDRIRVPGGTAAVGRLVGHVDTDGERFAGSLNRVLLSRLVNHDDLWERIPERRLLADYLSTVHELRRKFPARFELTLDDGELPEACLELARFFGFEYRDGDWVESRRSGAGDDRDLKRRVARALGLDIRFIAYRLQRGERVVVEILESEVDAPLPLAEWSALSGVAVTPENALSLLVQDQRLGLVLEGLRRADRGLPQVLAADGLRSVYLEGSLAFYRYAAALQLDGGRLMLPGGPDTLPAWRKLVGASPDDPKRFVLALLLEPGARAAHLWHAAYFADPATGAFLLADSKTSAGMRSVLLAYVDRVIGAENAGLLSAGRGGDYSVSTLARSIPLDDGPAARRNAAEADAWIVHRGLQQPCIDAPRLDRIVRKLKGRGVAQDRFLEHLVGDQAPLQGTLGLLFQPFIEAQGLFARDRGNLTPSNVMLLRRAAAFRPLLLRTLLYLPFEDPGDLTDYLLTAERLDCLPPAPGRDSVLLTFQGGIDLLAWLSRDGQLSADAVAARLNAWIELHRAAEAGSGLGPQRLEWLRTTVSALADPSPDAAGRGPAERRLLASLSGTRRAQAFRANALDYAGRRGSDLAATMEAFLVSQSIAPLDLFRGLEQHVEELERSARAREDMQMRLTAFRILALIETLPVPAGAGRAGLEDPGFGGAVRHRAEVRDFIETAWRGQARISPADIADTISRVTRLIDREFEGLLCSLSYLRPIALIGGSRFDQPLFVLRHTVDREADPQITPLEVFPSAWDETAVVPAAFSSIGSHVAGGLTHVGRALVQRHVLELAPERPAHTWINVGPWFNAAIEASWQELPRPTLRLASVAIDAGDALIAAAAADRTTLPEDLSRALDRIVPRRRFQDAAAGGAARPLSSPGDRLQAGLLLLGRDHAPTGLDEARRRVATAAAAAGSDARAALQVLGVPTPRLNGRLLPWVGQLPPYEALEREASVAALRERQLLDVWLAVIRYVVARDLPSHVGYDILFRVLESLPEDALLESERDWESLVRFTNALEGPHLDRRLRECLIRGLYTVKQL